MTVSRKWILKKKFEGAPSEDNFELVTEELPELTDGELLVKGVFHSVDPYMRPFMRESPAGTLMVGEQLAIVVESKSTKFSEGMHVLVSSGWRDYSVVKEESVTLPPDLAGLPLSYSLGAMGMPGASAYLCMLDVCKPKEGDTVVVTGAAGAAGSLAGQIAKIKGCKVIGFAGTDDKCKWLEKLGYDVAINYKTNSVEESVKKHAPDGVDCFFDCVAGDMGHTILKQMRTGGRYAAFGGISTYNSAPKLYDDLLPLILFKTLTLQGFMIFGVLDQCPRAFKELGEWFQQSKLTYNEHVTEGFENMPKAFLGLFSGENTGKAVVKA